VQDKTKQPGSTVRQTRVHGHKRDASSCDINPSLVNTRSRLIAKVYLILRLNVVQENSIVIYYQAIGNKERSNLNQDKKSRN
jgi:hypothetical protein